jgi:hypothetical protein
MVVIEKQQKRRLYWNMLVNFVPDLLIAWVATYYLFDRDWGAFFLTLIGLQAVSFLMWLKTFLWSWARYHFAGKRAMIEHLEGYLIEHRFPQPPKYLDGIEDYLNKIATDDRYDGEIRVSSATQLGILEGFRASGRFTLAMQTHFAFEAALEAYAKRFGTKQ